MTDDDWKEIRDLRVQFMGTRKGIALGNLIAENKRLTIESRQYSRANCKFRNPENGNCMEVGGFCLAVDDKYCKFENKEN